MDSKPKTAPQESNSPLDDAVRDQERVLAASIRQQTGQTLQLRSETMKTEQQASLAEAQSRLVKATQEVKNMTGDGEEAEQIVIDPEADEEGMVQRIPKGHPIILKKGTKAKGEGEQDRVMWSIGDDGRPYRDPEGEYTFAQAQKVAQIDKAKSKNDLLEVMKWMKENQVGPSAGGGQGDPFTNTLMQKLAEKAVENLAGGNPRVESKSGLGEFLQFFGVTDKEGLVTFAQMLSGGKNTPSTSPSILPATLKDGEGNPIGTISLTLPDYIEVKRADQDMRHKQEKHEATMDLFGLAKEEGGRALRAYTRSKEQPEEPPQQGNVPQINQPQIDYRQCNTCGMIFGVPKGITHFMCPNPECPNNKQPEMPPEPQSVAEEE